MVIGLKRRDPPAHRAAARFFQDAMSGVQKAMAHCDQLRAQQRARMNRLGIAGNGPVSSFRPVIKLMDGESNVDAEPEEDEAAMVVVHMRRPVETLRYEYCADPRPFLDAQHEMPLWDKQIRGIQHVLRRERTPYYGSIGAMLCYPPGVGKTRMISEIVRLDAIDRVLRGLPRFGYPTLVVAPLGLVLQWEEQLKLFNKPEMLSFEIVYGKGQLMSTDAALDVNVPRILACLDLVITTYHTLRCGAAMNEKRGLFAVPWHRIVVDEGTEITNRTTDMFHAVQKIDTPRRVYVSGVRLPNTRIREFNAILSFLRCDRLVPVMESTRVQQQLHQSSDDVLVIPDDDEVDDADLPTVTTRQPFDFDPSTISLVREITGELMIGESEEERDKGEERLMKQTQIVWIPFRESERKVYNDIVEKYLHGTERESKRLAMYTELRHACLSRELFLTVEERARLPPARTPHSKMQAVLDYERDRMLPGEKALVFGEWVEPLLILGSHLKARGLSYEIMQSKMSPEERFALVGRVKDHTSIHPRMVLFPLKIGSAGLDGLQGTTLGGGANHCLFLQGHWTPIAEIQAKGRIDRPGQSRRVYCTKFVMRDSVEQHVLDTNQAKEAGSALLFGTD